MIAVNWEQVRSRLRANEEALERSLEASPERIQSVYRQRARQLASSRTPSTSISPGRPVMVFRLERERYAIELTYLAEVLPFTGCTPVPGAAPSLLGVINLRGELHGILNLAQVLTIPRRSSTQSGFILVLRHSDRRIGLKVDSVEDLNQIRSEEVTTPMQTKYTKGLVSGTLALLEVEKLLDDVFSREGL